LISFEQFSRKSFLEKSAFPPSINPSIGISCLGLPTVAATLGGRCAYRRRNAWTTTKGTFAKVVGFIVLVSLVVMVPSAVSAQASGYAFERAIVINHSQVANADQSNFPVLISGTFSDLATAGNGGNVQSAQGYDIIFTSDAAGQTQLPFEQETYSASTGAINYWVQVPTLSHTTDTIIYMFYDNSSVTTDQSNKTAVWDTNYKGVWHLSNGTTLNANDSTSNANNGSVSGNISAAAGEVDGAASSPGTTGNVITTPNSITADSSPFTYSFWFNSAGGGVAAFRGQDGFGNGWSAVVQVGSNIVFNIVNSSPAQINLTSNAAIASGTWYYVTAVWIPGSGMKLYVNGTLDNSNTNNSGTLRSSTKGVQLSDAFNGLLDEVEISNTARSASWIATEYNNQSSPGTFAVPCPSQAPGGSFSNCLRPLPSSYAYVRAITLNHTQVPNTDQQNFPVLISATSAELANVSNGGRVQSLQGYDIIVTSDSAGQSQLDHEIDTYNSATGTVNFWVRMPTLSHTADTTIYMWYGNSAVPVSQENKPGVWSNGYAAVYHMGNGNAISGSDSTANNQGTVSSVSAATGVIGGGGTFSGSSSISAIPANTVSGSFTIEEWAKPSTTSGVLGLYGSRTPSDSSFDAKLSSASVYEDIGNGGSWLATSVNASFPFSVNAWHHFAHTLTSNAYQIYADGRQIGSGTFSGTPFLFDPNHYLLIGKTGSSGEGFSGSIDEARVSTVVRSADWIAAEYNNQSSPSSFAIFCQGQAVGSSIPACPVRLPTNTYTYSRAITISHAEVPNTDQQNFPVLISGTYADFANVLNGGKVQSPQGYDIVFTSDSAGQNFLDHEIDSYNSATGALNFWVRIPTLSHTADTTIYMWFGNSAVIFSQENKTGVWSNGYAAVYHMGNGSSISGSDSTGNNPGTVNSVSAASGLIGGSGSFGSSSSISAVPASSVSGAFTIEEWASPTSTSGTLYHSRAPSDEGFDASFTASGLHGDIGNGTAWLTTSADAHFAYSTNTWHHYVYCVTSNSFNIYQDGVLVGAGAFSGTPLLLDSTHYLHIGGSFPGLIDETRVSAVSRSADWIATEYNNQISPGTFLNIAGETPAVVSPQITSVTPVIVGAGTSMTINGTGFGATQQSGAVVLNNTLGTVGSWTNSQIVVTVPTGTSPGTLYVQQNGLNSNAVPFTINTPTVVSVSPLSGASGVSVNSSVVLTFNEAIDISTVNYGTVPISASGFSGVLSGTYTLDSSGKVLTFAPLSPIPSNATITVQVISGGVADLSGNHSGSFSSSFVTGSGSDTTQPHVASITPNNAATDIAPNTTVVLTFSKSLNSNTVTSNNLALIVNGSRLGFTISLSPDNRVVTLNANGLPGAGTVGVVATSGITDLYGNALVNFQSQFTTGVTDTTHPQVFSQRPGNGATGVPINTSIVIYFNDPMSASSVQGALHVSENGTAVNGTMQVTENGQVLQFTPSAALPAGTSIQVSVDTTALDLDGNTLNAYQGSFTTLPDTSTVAPQLVSANPVSGSTIPTNAVINLKFNEPLDPTRLTDTSVVCLQNNAWIQTALTLQGDNSLAQVVPRFAVAPNAAIACTLNTSLVGANGLAFGGGLTLQYTAGTGPDTTPPAIVSVSPPSGWTNIGDNAYIRILFSKPVNPLSVNASTIQLAGNGSTFVPDSIAFSNNNQNVLVTPHSPLPDSTVMSLTISGVTDSAGNPAASQTTQFTTGAGPDTVPPMVVATNPPEGGVNVPINSIVTLQISQPLDSSTVNNNGGQGFNLADLTTNQSVPGIYSMSSDGQTINFLPAASLNPNWPYTVNWGPGMTDLAGNACCINSGSGHFSFTTGSSSSASAPQVVQTSPVSGAAAIPTNAQLVIQFNEPVNGAKLSGVGVTSAGSTIATTQVLTNGNQTLRLIPAAPLSPSTAYTLTVSGLRDLSGNSQATPFTANFTTAAGADLTLPRVNSVNPGSGATAVSINSAIQLQFNKPINPLTVTSATFQVCPSSTQIPISGSISISTDGLTATLTPASPLDASTTYVVNPTSGITDLEGQGLQGLNNNQGIFSTDQTLAGLAPIISSLPFGTGGSVGNTVVLNGTYFGTSQGLGSVTFNGVPAPISSWTDTQIGTSVPSGATSGPLVVTVNAVASNSINFRVLAAAAISGVSPGSGGTGTSVTISGTNLGDASDSIQVWFNGALATPTSVSENSIVVPVPATAPVGSGSVTVQVDGFGSPSATSFTVTAVPVVSVLNPSSGVAGGTVNISGAKFGSSQGSSTVYFNGVPAASVSNWVDGTITVVAPNNVTTGPVTVVEGGVASNSNVVFTVTGPALGSMSPPAGAPGSVVNVAGSNLLVFGATTQIFFNGVASQIVPNGNGIPIISPTGFSAYVPTSATSGPVTIVIGGSTSNALNFTVEQAPTVTDISPNNGQAGTWPITITGSGFGATMSNSTVKFYDTVPAQIISWSDTEIQALAPQGIATGPISVQVGGLTGFGPSFYVTSPTVLTDSLGNQTTYNFGINGGAWGLASSTGSGCSTCRVRGNILESTDTHGNVTSHTDDLGRITSYTYSNNDVASVSQQLNPSTPVTTSYTYNSFGEVLTATDPLGNVTTNTYDTNGNLQTVTSPAPNGSTLASVTHFGYDTKGELTSITDPLSNPTTLTYTTTGLVASITDAQNHITSYQYDARGNRTAVIDPINGAGHPTTFAYDVMNRLTGITYPDGSSVSFGFDYRGRRTSVTDQNQKTTTYTYDDADRLTAVTDPANNTTYYAYDTEDNLSSITDANNHTTNFAYNARGWVTQTTFPSTLYETYGYDAVGNLTSKTDRKNQTIQYVYDALNRLGQKSYPDSTSVDYVYDLASKVTQVNDPTGVYGFAYDNMGRLMGTTVQYSFLPNQTFTNSYTYDAASNRKSLTAPDGSITTYGYDTLNRLNGLANSWAGSFSFGYDGLSRRTSLTRPNGVNTSYGYDSVSHLLSVLHQAGTNVLDGASYTYDPAGNRTSKINYLNGTTSNYTYDPLYELKQVTQDGSTTESYSYDAVANRLSSVGVPSYQYNASNELISNSQGSYTYDANGSTLSDPTGKMYTWDFENRLSSTFVPSTGTITFRYDPFGRRIQKSSPLGTTNYLYDQKNLVAEVDSSGNVIARYTQGKGIDRPLAQLRSGTTSYYQQDGLGSVTSLSNSASALAGTYTYDSYGKATASTGTPTNPLQYTAREFDSETTLLFNRARYFDPSLGRFLSQDPIRFAGGTNFYAYTVNNPIVRTDPLGYQSVCNNPAFCVPGSAILGFLYLGPDGVWYNDGPPPDPAPPVPNDGPTPSPNPPSPNKCDKGDQPGDDPLLEDEPLLNPPPDQPPPEPPPLVSERTCAIWGLADAWMFGFGRGSAEFGLEQIAVPSLAVEGTSFVLHWVVCGDPL
jgi:RHS repeat-associated protein